MKTKSPLPYYGSDSEVAQEIAGRLDGCKHVTIPFFGGGGIIRHLKARAIVAADKNCHAINFHRVLSSPDKRERLIDRCQKTLSHPDETRLAGEMINLAPEIYGDEDRAWAYWTICWVGRKGKGGTGSAGGNPSVRWSASGGANASRIRTAAVDLVGWSKEMERCDWVADNDFRSVIANVKDQEDCGLYVDAPWPGAGDKYIHKFVRNDHIDLSGALRRFGNAKVVIRYGDDKLIQDLYPAPRWHWHRNETRNQAGTKTAEVLITNRVGSDHANG